MSDLVPKEGQSFSPVMLKLVKEMNRYGGEVVRHPGGFWCCGDYSISNSFGTSTVEALVRRNAAEYVEWKEGSHRRASRFPVRAKLIAKVRTVLEFGGEKLAFEEIEVQP